MNKQELLDSICDLVNKRINEEFHINSETATQMISEYIDEYTEQLFKSEPVKQNPIIWGNGWYAIYEEEEEEDDYGIWYVAPKDFFDEHGRCPDGWEWDRPEGMTDEEFEDFIDEYGCEPNPPEGFSYCIESGFSCNTNITLEKQKEILRDAGFTVNNVTKWYYNR
jgi:hypothetical protein